MPDSTEETAIKPPPPATGPKSPLTPTALNGSPESAPSEPPRQLNKVKRFLATLQHFATDISPETGDRVHSLILGLLSSSLSIEEFHQKIQDATNYPLRSFVIPFLKVNVPLLQAELLHSSRMAHQTPQQYLRQNELSLLDLPGGEPLDFFLEQTIKDHSGPIKRRPSPTALRSPRENGYADDPPPPTKRLHTTPPPRISPGPHHGSFRIEDAPFYRYERFERSRDYIDDMEEEWKNIYTMLNCILGMVEKTKRALAILQQRSHPEFPLWASPRRAEDPLSKKRDLLAAQYKSVEERVAEMRRRAEEAVNEVKRQAVAEVQKAVSAAETKASEMVAAERARIDTLVLEARKQASEEALTNLNRQEESTENCWNCGRKAHETCSGCNVARYCGSFCQHKDWENHHKVCRSQAEKSPATSVARLAPKSENKVSADQ